MGFDPDTKDKAELAAIDKKYEDMIRELTEWNDAQQKRKDEIALAGLKLEQGSITQKQYSYIYHGA